MIVIIEITGPLDKTVFTCIHSLLRGFNYSTEVHEDGLPVRYASGTGDRHTAMIYLKQGDQK